MAIRKIDPTKSGTMRGTGASLERDTKGNLKAIRDKNFAGQRNDSMSVDRKIASGSSNGSFSGGVAPRVGGTMRKGPGKRVVFYSPKKKVKKRGTNF